MNRPNRPNRRARRLPLRPPAGVGHSLLTSLAYALQMLVVTALLSRSATPEQFGAFGYALALLTPLLLAFNLNLRTLVLTDPAEHAHRQPHYFALTVLLTLAFLLVTVALAAAHDGPARSILLASGALKSVEMLTSITTASHYKRDRADLVALCQTVRSIVVVAAFALVHGSGGSIAWALTAAAVASLAQFAALDWRLTSVREGFAAALLDPRRLTALQINRTGIALVASVPVLNAMLQNSPRYMLGDQGRLGDVAVVTVLMYFAMPGNLAAGAYAAVVTPRLNRLWTEGDLAGYVRGSLRGVALAVGGGVALCGIGLVAGERIIAAVFTTAYAGHGAELTLMLAISTAWFGATMVHVSVNAARGYRLALASSVAGIAVAAALYLFWPRPAGLDSLTWTLCVYGAGMACRLIALGAGFARLVAVAGASRRATHPAPS